ncbi:uncharacterized protein HKW66_Vig0181760 [Vigna angularis]|uniref:UBZ4-type domain-containing protein n=1 Tax=Phaseolus angularis TaxID=3914 RepID=A0A8T0K4E2_PHAAN|nr:uncharacterized protein HKW66_Vig0181760 [Vigna angularis]
MIRCGRDYTSKIRAVDVFKCWPFAAEGVSRWEAESWLPPMTVPKFSGWSDEFVELRSNLPGDGGDQGRENRESQAVSDDSESEKVDKFVSCGCDVEEEEVEEEQEKIEMICPVCRDFNAATLTAVNAHIDGCLMRRVREERQRIRRLKLKAPKKRSIAEIFELKEDVEEEKRPPEIETEMKLLPLDACEVSSAVTKLRWLSERLEALRSNGISFESVKSLGAKSNSPEKEKSERLRPGCRVFNTVTETAANEHINGCLATAMREEGCRRPSLDNPKPKAPKKRSIADILTVALPIDGYGDGKLAAEGEIDDEGEELEKHGFSGVRIKSKKCTNNIVRKKKKVKKKNKVEKQSVLCLNGESKKINKRKKKKKKLNNVFTATKEDACKRKMQNPVHSLRKLGTVGNKKVKLDDIDASSAREMKLGAKIVSVDKKEKLKNWDLVVTQQKAVSPVHGTLKNHKHISGSTSSGSNIQNDTEESHYDVQVPSLDKHLGFSVEDSVLSPKKRNSFDETVLSLSSDTLASSFGKEQSSGNVGGSSNLEERRKDNTAINTDNRKEVSPIVESRQFSNILGQVFVQNILKPCTNLEKSKNLFENPESLSHMTICDNNLHRFDGNTTTLHGNGSRSLSAFQGGQSSGINTQACESEAFSYAGKFIDHLGGPTFQPKHANTRTYLEPSPSYSASCDEINERPEFPFRTHGNKDNNGQALGGRSLSGTFSADMVANSFLLPGWGKGSAKNHCMEQNSYGLPLNSHGELINFGSGGKVGMIQPETSCTFRGSLIAPLDNVFHENSQDYLRIGKRHVVQKTPQDRGNPFPHYSGSWLGVRELHSRKNEDIYPHNSDCCSNLHVQPLDSEVNLLRNPFIEKNQLGKVPNHREYGIISPRGSPGLVSSISSQPTMRLMGKDVPIGRSSKEKQQIFGGVIWAEEESRRRHYSEDDDSLLGRCYMRDWATGSNLQRQTENVLQSVKIQSNQALQSTLLMKSPNSEFINLQSDHISQNASLGTSRNTSTNLRRISEVPTSCAIYSRQPEHLPEQFVSGAKTPGLCFHSQVPSSPYNFHLSTLSNGEQNGEKKRHRVTNSALGFPFLHPIVEEQAKSSWFKRSYTSFPASSLGSTYQKMPGSSTTTSFHQNAWRNDSTTPFVNHSDVLHPNSGTSHYPRNSPLSPKSSTHPHSPYASVSSVAIDGCRKILRVTDRVKLDDMIAKDQHPCTNARKRPAANTFDPAIPNKLLNIEMHKNSSTMTGLGRVTSSTNLPKNTREVELNLQVGARSECVLNEARNLNPTSHFGFGCSDQDGVVVSGPVKLGPGAKHILKPSQNLDNSTPIHSAISIAATSDCGRDLELQGKLTKMYIF